MFRDRVSEGQFAAVFAAEVKAIKNAYAEMFPQLKFALTFLIVQKRHHLRMFPDNCPTDRSGNVVPGVVVDTKIVHPREFDFYLMSHAGIQGTSRPVKYHVLYDEIGFSSDQMRKFVCFFISKLMPLRGVHLQDFLHKCPLHTFNFIASTYILRTLGCLSWKSIG
jgi:eukaryotic translation initiation factor 2C